MGATFLDYMEILGTALHELAHMEVGPHNAMFYSLMDRLEDEFVNQLVQSTAGQVCGGQVSTRPKRDLMKEAAERRLNTN